MDTVDRVIAIVRDVDHYIENFQYIDGVTPYSGIFTPALVAVVYLAVIYSIYTFMKDREKYTVMELGTVHNFNMLAISVICFCGIGYGVIRVFVKHNYDVEPLFCDSRHLEAENKGPLYFWLYVFALSKFYELLDTVIIALRKSKMTFLHVYHHAITTFLCFWCLKYGVVTQWSGTGLNALVHIPMYAYYLGSTLDWQNMWWKIYITQSQILQFVLVVLCQGTSFVLNYGFNWKCRSFEQWYSNSFGLCVIVSYLLLFIQFYFTTYKERKKK